ncbi:MAG: Hsp20/alpha crystallin family protein, partial [Rhodospirillales bacterium]
MLIVYQEVTTMALRNLIPVSHERSLPGERCRFDPFHAAQREMNRMFEDVWNGFDLPVFRSGNGAIAEVTPRVDVSETKRDIRVTAELPGMEEKDVEVTFADGLLTIQGEHKA